MEQILDQSTDELEVNHDFSRGFNNSYLIAEHEPELLADIIPSVNLATDYFRGFFSGKEQWDRDCEQRQLHELSQMRKQSLDRNQETEREV